MTGTCYAKLSVEIVFALFDARIETEVEQTRDADLTNSIINLISESLEIAVKPFLRDCTAINLARLF